MEDLQKSIEQNRNRSGKTVSAVEEKDVLYHRSDGDRDHHILIGDEVSDTKEI